MQFNLYFYYNYFLAEAVKSSGKFTEQQISLFLSQFRIVRTFKFD